MDGLGLAGNLHQSLSMHFTPSIYANLYAYANNAVSQTFIGVYTSNIQTSKIKEYADMTEFLLFAYDLKQRPQPKNSSRFISATN